MGKQVQLMGYEKYLLPVGVGLFASSTIAILGQYSALLFDALTFHEWLFLMLPIVALVSVYLAAFIHSPRTPITVHLFELGLVITITVALVRWAEEISYPWYSWRAASTDPMMQFPLFCVLTTWFFAGSYGNQLVKMRNLADYLGDQAASTVTWEYESLASKVANSSVPVEYFLVRFIGLASLISILAIIVARLNITIPTGLHLIMSVLGACWIISGLALQGMVYLFRLQMMWQYADIKLHPGFGKDWLKNLLILSLIAALLIMVIPTNLSPVKYDHIAGFVMDLIDRLGAQPGLDMDLGIEQSPPSESDGQIWDQVEHGELSFFTALFSFILLALVVGGFGFLLLAIIGMVLATLIKSEVDRLRGLPLLAVRAYKLFSSVLRQWWQMLATLGRWGKVKWENYTSKQQKTLEPGGSLNTKSRQTPAKYRQDVRQMFRVIVKAGKQVGIIMHAGQTPRQYGQMLQKELPEEDEELGYFFDTYQQVRYSRRDLSSNIRQKAITKAKHIIMKIKEIGQGE